MFEFYKIYTKEIKEFEEILRVENIELFDRINLKINETSNQIDNFKNNQKGYIKLIREEHIKIFNENTQTSFLAIEGAYYYIFKTLLNYSKRYFTDEDMRVIAINRATKNNQVLLEHCKKYYKNNIVEMGNVISLGGLIYTMALLILSAYKADIERENAPVKSLLEIALTDDMLNNVYKDAEKFENAANSKQGCYVATAVYGSYDCPEVWLLRRYRDYYLDNNIFGRIFIKIYYVISPTLVKWFGKSNWFKKIIKPILENKIKKLRELGYSDKEYDDKY